MFARTHCHKSRGRTMCAGACLLALCTALLIAPLVRAETAAHSTARQDVRDFDPAMLAFVAVLLHLPNGPGPLQSIVADARSVTLRFATAALVLPEGLPDAATVMPLGERL